MAAGAGKRHHQLDYRHTAFQFLIFMRKNLIKKKNGFTLVELLIAIIVGSLVMLALYMAMVMSQRTSAGVGRKVITQQDTRAVLDIMASEIAMASFNPLVQPATWSPTSLAAAINCGNVTGVIGGVAAIFANKGILFADASNIYVAMDLGGPIVSGKVTYGTIGDLENEYIFYSYDPGTRAIRRSTNCSNLFQILGGTALGSNVINQTAGIPVFQYFDRDGQLLPLPINIPAIRRIKITIVAETAEIDLNTKKRKRMIYSTDIIVRNHAAFSPSP